MDTTYPTEKELELIEDYDIMTLGADGLIEKIKGLWHWKDFFRLKGNKLTLITGGWSGNEDLVYALERNRLFWSLTWQESKRGGLYKFNLKYVRRYWLINK